MLSNFRNQLKEQGMSERLDDVLKEIPYVRECLGWIPLVTPTSQIVGTQAMLNVKMGRWKMISGEAMDIALGKFGKTPGPVSPDLLAEVIKRTGEKPVECRPADLLKPRMAELKAELKAKGFEDSDENAVLWAMFPLQLEKVLKGEKPAPVAKPAAASPEAKAAVGRKYVLNVDGQRHEVLVEQAG